MESKRDRVEEERLRRKEEELSLWEGKSFINHVQNH